MTKYVAALLLFAGIVAFVIWQRGSVKTAYVNGLPQYTDLPGTEYIFERDCYIFKADDRPSTYPLVGANTVGSAKPLSDLPSKVSAESIGKTFGAVRVIDLLHIGDRFKIVSVRRDQYRDKTDITFEILLVNEAERKYPRLDSFYILDHSPEKEGRAPRVFEDYAVARVKL